MKHSDDFAKLAEDARSRIKEVSAEQVHRLLQSEDEFLVVDVREEREWVAGHLPKATHLSKGIIERDINKIADSKDQHIILYCGGGYRSALAAENLQKMGYRHVSSMAGGVRLWRELGYPLGDE